MTLITDIAEVLASRVIRHSTADIPIVVMVPACECGEGLDDTTRILKCPKCKVVAKEETE